MCCGRAFQAKGGTNLRFHSPQSDTILHCCLSFRSSASQVHLDGPTTSSQYRNHDRPAELRCRGTVSVEQSSHCFIQTGDDTAPFQATTQGLSVSYLMCSQTEVTCAIARCCFGVFRDSDTEYKTLDLLTYLHCETTYTRLALCCVPDYFPAFAGTHFAYPRWMARLS